MAKFVLAGKSDCPYFAKAALLADKLQRCLPNFRVHKISILPDDWMEWLEDTCKRNGWKHKQSPVVWRELVYQGGAGMLLGGFSDFLEHCQDYYNITSDMPTEKMLSVAAENLETQMKVSAEEQCRAGQIKLFHIWISSALNPTCRSLIPNLLSAEVFPNVPAVSLHLLELQGDSEELGWLKEETQDLAIPLLHQVSVHTDLEMAFQEADVILLLEDFKDSDEDEEEDEEEEEEDMRKISDRYKDFGQLINLRANREVKVIVSGGSFTNMRCSVLLENAQSISSNKFVATATQLENEARAIIAKKLKVKTSDVSGVIVWGNISGSFYIDLQRARVFNYDGAIKGPDFFSKSVLLVLHDRRWLETDFQALVSHQRAAVASVTCRSASMSEANGILSVLKAWNGDPDLGEVFSLGVCCPGYYNLPDGLILSVPVKFIDGKWSVVYDITVGDELKEKLQIFATEVQQEKERGCERNED